MKLTDHPSLFPLKYPKQKSPSTEKPLTCSFKKSISKSLNVVSFWSSSMAKSSGKGKLGLRSHYSPNQKLGSQKIFEKLKPQPEVPKNVTIFGSHYRNTRIGQNEHSWSDFISDVCCAVINMNPNQAFCFAFAILLLQIIDMQQQQMFAFFTLYQRWINDYMHIVNVAFLRRRRHLRRIRVGPYTCTIPRHLLLTFIACALGSKLAI